jgi:menaquinone-9 beta-reductase
MLRFPPIRAIKIDGMMPHRERMSDSQSVTNCDVTVIGGGLAGKAASMHLAKAGMKVICIEPAEPVRPPVGESLDWSTGELLKALGLPMDEVISGEMGTWKRHVIVRLRDGLSRDFSPFPWFGDAPFHVELRTLHVDRTRLDEELLQRTIDNGVTLVRDRVVQIETKGKQVCSVLTAGGERFTSSWFIDASGFAACLLAREFNLRAVHYGPTKVAIWTYFSVKDSIDGTTLYSDPSETEYLDWIWEIPIKPGVASVGYVTAGESIKAMREQGLSVEDIFRQKLLRFPRFKSILESETLSAPNVTSFRSRVYSGTSGPNWMIVGEAASMVDPITANGVTAALRHAAEASRLILKYYKYGSLPRLARFSYTMRVQHLAGFYNSGVEKIVYQPPIRNRIGTRHAGAVFISPAWLINLLYARLSPNGILSTFLFSSFLAFFQVCGSIFFRLCKLFSLPARMPS